MLPMMAVKIPTIPPANGAFGEMGLASRPLELLLPMRPPLFIVPCEIRKSQIGADLRMSDSAVPIRISGSLKTLPDRGEIPHCCVFAYLCSTHSAPYGVRF